VALLLFLVVRRTSKWTSGRIEATARVVAATPAAAFEGKTAMDRIFVGVISLNGPRR